MDIQAIRDSLPDYARDLRLNLGSVLAPTGAPGLDEAQIWGIALASAIAAWLNAALLALMLKRRGAFAPDARLGERLPRMIAATIAMAALLWGLLQPLAAWLASGLALRASALALLVAGGLVGFALAAQLLKATDLRDLMRQLGVKS